MSNRMSNIVQELNALITAYGLTEVKHVLDYIANYPVQPVTKAYTMADQFGTTWVFTGAEFKSIKDAYMASNKISAIKLFRDITFCSLTEAKNAVETSFKRD